MSYHVHSGLSDDFLMLVHSTTDKDSGNMKCDTVNSISSHNCQFNLCLKKLLLWHLNWRMNDGAHCSSSDTALHLPPLLSHSVSDQDFMIQSINSPTMPVPCLLILAVNNLQANFGEVNHLFGHGPVQIDQTHATQHGVQGDDYQCN